MNHMLMDLKGERPSRVGRYLTILTLSLLLSGCQAMTERWCETAAYCQVSPEDDAFNLDVDLIDYALMVDAMNETALRAEDDRLRESLEGTECTNDHLRLALVSSRLQPDGDLPAPALEGLAHCSQSAAEQPARAALASLLHDVYEQRATSDSRIEELERALSHQRSHNRALEEQIEALKAIERSIIERSRE